MIGTGLNSGTGAEVVRGADSSSAMGLDGGTGAGVVRLGGPTPHLQWGWIVELGQVL